MTDATREERFQRYVAGTDAYNAAIEEAGDQPWWMDPAKLARLEPKIPGITQMPPEDRRRALYMRHRTR